MIKNLQYLFIFSLISCSLGSLLIGKLDYYITHKTASRLGLYVKQEDKLREDVKVLLDNIKPEIKTLNSQLQNIKNNIKKTEKVINHDLLLKFQKLYVSINEKLFEILLKYLSELTEKQQKPFLETLKKQIKKMEKKTSKKKQHEKLIADLEKQIGSLTPSQKLSIKQIKKELYQFQILRLENKKNQLTILTSAYERSKSERLIYMQKHLVPAEQAEKVLGSKVFTKIKATLISIFTSLNKKQRSKLEDKLEDIIDLLDNFIENKYTD